MKRITASFLFIAVVLWLMPLGAFIKPSQEKTACDGKRAFHMCSMMGKVQTEERTAFSAQNNGSGAAKNMSSSGDDYLINFLAELFVLEKKLFRPKLVFSFSESPSRNIFIPPKLSIF